MLPKIKHSVYKHHLKGIDKEVSYRPYTNKEQKILLLAKEEANDDPTRIVDAILQVLDNCILDPDINIDKLPICDIEDLFIRIRSKSVGEVITVKYSYDYEDENGATKTDFVSHDINIDEITIKGDHDAENIIILDDEQQLGIKLRYPSMTDIFEAQKHKDQDTELLKRCIDSIFDKDEVYDLAQVSDDEFNEFVDDIEGPPMLKIKKFFESMPRLSYTFEIELPKIKKKETKTIKGIEGFFT